MGWRGRGPWRESLCLYLYAIWPSLPLLLRLGWQMVPTVVYS